MNNWEKWLDEEIFNRALLKKATMQTVVEPNVSVKRFSEVIRPCGARNVHEYERVCKIQNITPVAISNAAKNIGRLIDQQIVETWQSYGKHREVDSDMNGRWWLFPLLNGVKNELEKEKIDLRLSNFIVPKSLAKDNFYEETSPLCDVRFDCDNIGLSLGSIRIFQSEAVPDNQIIFCRTGAVSATFDYKLDMRFNDIQVDGEIYTQIIDPTSVFVYTFKPIRKKIDVAKTVQLEWIAAASGKLPEKYSEVLITDGETTEAFFYDGGTFSNCLIDVGYWAYLKPLAQQLMPNDITKTEKR